MNKTNLLHVTAVLFALLAVRLHASMVTLEIDQSGFANSASVPTNGMTWGIVVDTSASNGLSLVSDGINSLPITTDGFLRVGGAATPDYYFWNNAALVPNQTTTSGPPPFFRSGYIGTTGPLSTGVNGVAAGDSFGVLWFQSNGSAGSKYGFLTNSAFVLPANGGTSLPFTSDITSSAKAADLTIGASQIVSTPEPSTFFPLAFFSLGVLLAFRKRLTGLC